jgi:hypothetical protein
VKDRVSLLGTEHKLGAGSVALPFLLRLLERLGHAIVIRTILLPAVLELLGRRIWSFPGWVDRRLPRLAIEPEPAPAATELTPALNEVA